jgi:galactonate dehydratase
MKITSLETFHADAGWRNFSFLKLTTDTGIVGWSEFQEGFGSPGVGAAIAGLSHLVIGQDPRHNEKVYADLYASTRPAAGGVAGQAIGAIENAMLDAKAKHYGVPCYELLGGRMRERIRLYWSHCGTYRINWPEVHPYPPIKSLKDIEAMGREVRDAGFTGLKTNVFLFDRPDPGFAPGFNRPANYHELNAERGVIRALIAELEAFRAGAGDDMDILLDLNFNFKTEGYLKITDALASQELFWIEIDSYNPDALGLVRQRSRTPISSGETLFGIREFRPYFEAQAMDVAIIDTPWNGVWQSMKIANLAEAYEINVAPHNFYGHLCTMMNAHFAAAVPNLRIMEIDTDEVPWRGELYTELPQIEDGHLIISDRPGWGTEPNEAALKAHPPRATGGGTMVIRD